MRRHESEPEGRPEPELVVLTWASDSLAYAQLSTVTNLVATNGAAPRGRYSDGGLRGNGLATEQFRSDHDRNVPAGKRRQIITRLNGHVIKVRQNLLCHKTL